MMRVDLDLGGSFGLVIAGDDGTFGLRVVRETGGRTAYLTPPTPLTYADVVTIASNLQHLARVEGRAVPAALPGFDDQALEGKSLAEALAVLCAS